MRKIEPSTTLSMSNRLYKIYLLLKIMSEQFGYESTEAMVEEITIPEKQLKSFYAFSNFINKEIGATHKVVNVEIVTFFPKIVIQSTASEHINTLARNMFVKSIFHIDDIHPGYSQELFRNIYSNTEWSKYYKHSHSSDGSQSSLSSFSQFCLGSSAIVITSNTIAQTIVKDDTEIPLSEYVLMCNTFCIQLLTGIKVESIEGGPYKKIASVFNKSLQEYNIIPEFHTPNLLSSTFENAPIEIILLKYVDKNTIKTILNFTTVHFTDNIPCYNIDYYNILKTLSVTPFGKALIKISEKLNSVYYINVIDDIDHQYFYNKGNGVNSINPITSRLQKESAVQFKGKPVNITILPDDEYYNINSNNTYKKTFIPVGNLKIATGIIRYIIILLTTSMLKLTDNLKNEF